MELDMPVSEAFTKIRQDGLHKNLFKHGGKTGTGRHTQGQGRGSSDPNAEPQREDYKDDQSYSLAWQTWRKKQDEGKSTFEL